jgi:hypothetical protein
MTDIERPMTDTERTLATLLTELYDSAAVYALGRLVERRPGLDRPPEPRIPVPAEEELRVSLDQVGFVAFIQQGLVLACDLPVVVALRAGATWSQVGEALRCTAVEARERYDHLAVIADDAPATGPEDGEVA